MSMRPIHKEREMYDEDSFEEMLNDLYGTVEICGCTFNSGYALKELDPIAFRCGLADMQEYEDVYICPICEEEFCDEEDALYCCQDEDYNDEEE